ncbi:MAG TPA: hypothetical protein VIQ31_09710 [Phormidium sp.]
MKNLFLLLVNKLWQKQQLFIPKMNHFLNHFKPLKNDREHCRMSFRAPAIAGVIISTVLLSLWWKMYLIIDLLYRLNKE